MEEDNKLYFLHSTTTPYLAAYYTGNRHTHTCNSKYVSISISDETTTQHSSCAVNKSLSCVYTRHGAARRRTLPCVVVRSAGCGVNAALVTVGRVTEITVAVQSHYCVNSI